MKKVIDVVGTTCTGILIIMTVVCMSLAVTVGLVETIELLVSHIQRL